MIGLATKRDFFLVSIIGILFGLLLIPILENIKPAFWDLNFINVFLLVAGFFIFANLSLAVAGLLGKKHYALWQFAKYGAGGALSAMLDMGLLNLLSLIFNIFSGPLIIVLNSFSIYAAMTNSYFWNKLWAFKKEGGGIFNLREYLKFIGVTLGSLVIGSLMVYFTTTHISAPAGISEQLWENIAKLISIPFVVAWNFVLYKFVIFKQ